MLRKNGFAGSLSSGYGDGVTGEAIKEVRQLSEPESKQLLDWLEELEEETWNPETERQCAPQLGPALRRPRSPAGPCPKTGRATCSPLWARQVARATAMEVSSDDRGASSNSRAARCASNAGNPGLAVDGSRSPTGRKNGLHCRPSDDNPCDIDRRRCIQLLPRRLT